MTCSTPGARSICERATQERDRIAEEIVRGTAERLGEIDPLIAEAAANWRLERIAVIDRLILRLATYELLAMPGTPHAVIINEALELARTFSTEDAVKFVNGVLDGIRKKVRGASAVGVVSCPKKSSRSSSGT